MTEPRDPQNPAERAPYEAPSDATRPFAAPAESTPAESTPAGSTPSIPAQPPTHGPVSRRTLAATGVAALLVGGVLGGVIGWASTDSGPVRTTTVAETQTATAPQGGTGSAHKRSAKGVAGTISAISGSTWTVQTPRGDSITVTIGSDTRFGTAAAPAQASDFAVGDRVVVAGTRTGTSVAATRVVERPARTAGTPSGATPPSSTPS